MQVKDVNLLYNYQYQSFKITNNTFIIKKTNRHEEIVDFNHLYGMFIF